MNWLAGENQSVAIDRHRTGHIQQNAALQKYMFGRYLMVAHMSLFDHLISIFGNSSAEFTDEHVWDDFQ